MKKRAEEVEVVAVRAATAVEAEAAVTAEVEVGAVKVKAGVHQVAVVEVIVKRILKENLMKARTLIKIVTTTIIIVDTLQIEERAVVTADQEAKRGDKVLKIIAIIIETIIANNNNNIVPIIITIRTTKTKVVLVEDMGIIITITTTMETITSEVVRDMEDKDNTIIMVDTEIEKNTKHETLPSLVFFFDNSFYKKYSTC